MEKIMEFIGSHNKHGDGPLARKKCRLTRAKAPQSIFRPDQDVRNSSAPTGAIRFPAIAKGIVPGSNDAGNGSKQSVLAAQAERSARSAE
jgi:hypothetical protein